MHESDGIAIYVARNFKLTKYYINCTVEQYGALRSAPEFRPNVSQSIRQNFKFNRFDMYMYQCSAPGPKSGRGSGIPDPRPRPAGRKIIIARSPPRALANGGAPGPRRPRPGPWRGMAIHIN